LLEPLVHPYLLGSLAFNVQGKAIHDKVGCIA
jgi:hypothetical protein